MSDINPVLNIPEIKLNDVDATKAAPVENSTMPVENQVNQKESIKLKIKLPRFNKKIAIPIAIALVAIFLLIFIPSIAIYGKAKNLVADAKTIKTDFSKQDINLIEKDVSKLKEDLISFQSSYNMLGWIKVVPFLGNYWNDGNHAIKGGLAGIEATQIGIQTSKPYADIIGFSGPGGKKAANAEENANDRIQFIVSTIKDILPRVDSVSEKAKIAKSEIDQIDPGRYPKTFAGKKVQENLKTLTTLTDEVADMTVNSKPLLEAAPYMLGIDSPRTYLIIFQNDKELRPTGGFITGYSVMTVDKGKVSNVTSNDIYNLDKAYTPTVKAPDPIIKYIKGPYLVSPNLRLRDMNFDPDFKNSMNTFVTEAQKAGIPKIDGVIAVDTQVLVNLLNVLGNIGVPGYGDFNTKIIPECNCPQVIHELESFADVEGAVVWDQNDPTKIIFAPANYYNRKAIVGPLMNSVLKNALGQPKEKLPKLFEAAWNSLVEKHVLFYMLNNGAQQGVEAFNIAGRIHDIPSGEDYFYAVDSNLGGRKSNLYITNEVEQVVSISSDGTVTRTVSLTYKNPQGYDGWLNSVLPSWLRIYVPKGSQLISIEGLDDKKEAYEELEKTVFAGLYTLRPQGVSKIIVKYKLPFKVKGEYKLSIQKQPGVDSVTQTLKVGKQVQEAILRSDQEFRFRI